jgi:predicted ATPase
LAIMVRSLCLWPLGYPEQASRASNQAIDWAEEIHSPYTLAYVLCFGRFIEYFLREPDAALRQTDWCKALCDEHGYSVEILSLAKCLRGWALVCHGDSDNGLPVAIAGLNEYSAADALTFQPASLTVVADACITAGKPEQGLEFLARSLSVAENIGDAFWKSECHRIRGELLLQSSDDNQAEADFAYRRAIEAAQSQEAKSWELRAATSRARLWQSQGKRYEAHDLLGGIYGWFTEGFDTADLKDAKALLDELK